MCLYFTDMECAHDPETEPAFPVLWVLSCARDRTHYFANRPMWRDQDYVVAGD